MKRPSLLVLLLAVLVGWPSAAYADGSFSGETTASAEGRSVTLSAREARATEQAWEAAAVDPAVRLIEYMRADLCAMASSELSDGGNQPCADGRSVVPPPDCEGLTAVQPLWRRTRTTPTGPWSAWEFVSGWSCPQEAVPVFTAEDFRRLPLAPPTLRQQPATDTVLINIPTITMTDPTPQQLTTDLLDLTIEVQATPTSFTWDYGDGTEPLTTTSPGHPYPDHDVHHTYVVPGTYQITLTATFTGRYRLAGATSWTDITGTAATSVTGPPITAVERRTHLVADA